MPSMDTRQCNKVLHVLYGTRLVTVQDQGLHKNDKSRATRKRRLHKNENNTETRMRGYTRMMKAEQQELGATQE